MKNISTITLALAASTNLIASEFILSPNAHLNTTIGASTAPEESLASHGHDPNDEFSLQGLELSLSAEYGYLAGFISYNTFLDLENDIDGELEEAFLKLQNLPGGFEIRAGRLFNRVTTQNSIHLHGWNFVDSNLITPRFLGDEGLLTNSIELTYKIPVEHNLYLTAAYGDAIPHEEEEEEHGPGEIPGEEGNPADDIFTLRLKGQFNNTDFHQFTYGASYINSQNGFGEDTNVYGVDFQYLWRENGLEAGGKYARFDFEALYRTLDFAEDGISGDSTEWGISTSAAYGFAENWEVALRYGYLEGIDELAELPERHRYTAALTRGFTVNDYISGHLRLQTNYERSSEFGEEQSIFLQAQLNFGKGEEVR